MHFHQTIAENGKQLKRIAALLFALAGLAERAAGRSGAVCLLVVWLIRPCEAIARDYLDAIAPGAAWSPTPAWPGDGKAEALRLAEKFRFLAAALAALAALAQHCLAPLPASPVNRRPAGFFSAPLMRRTGPPSGRSTLPDARGPPASR